MPAALNGFTFQKYNIPKYVNKYLCLGVNMVKEMQ